jgi:ABC-type branched-subunit amino acid transport system permease subunit
MPRQIWLALLGLLLIILPFGLKGYTVYILSIAGANILAAVGLNLLMGYAGQVSIGQAAFLAIGGYTSALLMTKLGLSFWLAFPLAGMLTSLTGLILFIPALRLGTIYLAIATLGSAQPCSSSFRCPTGRRSWGDIKESESRAPRSGASSSIPT